MIKILLVTSQKQTGLTYHRQTVPHSHLTRNYEGYEVDLSYDVSDTTIAELQKYQIVSFLRIIDHQGQTEAIINKCKAAGCKVVMDIDDHFDLPKTHELYDSYNKNNIPQQTITALKNVDWVTTTTPFIASQFLEYNKNITVIPNSIDTTEEQFKPSLIESRRLRFGYIAGVFHTPDAKLMFEGMKEVNRTVDRNKFQFCLGGYNPNEAYNFIEFMFTNEYKSISKAYKDYLLKYDPKDNNADNEPYKRLWGKDVFNYAKLYNEVDVSLVPLVNNKFNNCKSQIKIIEAGHFKKAAIVSNVMPYTLDCTKENSILINPDKRNSGWNTAIKSLIQNTNKAKDLGEKLHETVKENYYMDTVNKVRHDLYQHLCTA